MNARTYGELELTDSSPPQSFIEPVTLAEAKAYLRRLTSDEETLIQAMIPAAREIAEIHQGRDLVVKQYDLYLDQLPAEIQLRTPLRSVDLVQATDSQGVVTIQTEGLSLDYQVNLHRGTVTPSFALESSGEALIRFSSGYAGSHPFWLDAGRRIKLVMQILISGWFSNRIPFDPSLPASAQQYPPYIVDMLSWGGKIKVH